MREIKMLVKDIQRNLEGAEHCAKIATQYKLENPELAAIYAKIGEGKIMNVMALHDEAERMIRKKKEAGVEVPAAMQAVWDWEHDKMMDTLARVKMMLEVYRQH